MTLAQVQSEKCPRTALTVGGWPILYERTDVAQGRRGSTPTCSVDGCEGPGRQRGWCSLHYQRWKRTGDPLGFKRCAECSVLIPTTGDGRSFCEACSADRRRQRNRDWMRLVYRPTVGIEQNRAWRQANREKVRVSNRRSHKNNPESRMRASARWRAKNPEVVAAMGRRAATRRRVRLLAAESGPYLEALIFERDSWVCQLCLLPIDPTLNGRHPMSKSIDHRIPLSRGGADTEANVQAAHLGCNSRKGARV